ncbi:MAG: hypothetical protein JXB18_09000 [Sedimentisphaerales bacterium]|nr:hypothetical protein [Sedimentisphaerales bacterium]
MTFSQMLIAIGLLLAAVSIGYLNDKLKKKPKEKVPEKKWHSQVSWFVIVGAIGVLVMVYVFKDNLPDTFFLTMVLGGLVLLGILLYLRKSIWLLLKAILSGQKMQFITQDKHGNITIKCPKCSARIQVSLEVKEDSFVCNQCGEKVVWAKRPVS